jgi:hypothetical protein
MAFPEGAEEVVAVAADRPDRAGDGIYCVRKFHGACAFYLFAVLVMGKNYAAKETVLVIAVGFLVLHLVFKGRVFLYCALGIGLAGVFSFWLSEQIDWVWRGISRLMGFVSNAVLLTIIFFLVVTPVGLIRRLSKKGFDPGAKSNFSDREHVVAKEDFEKTW